MDVHTMINWFLGQVSVRQPEESECISVAWCYCTLIWWNVHSISANKYATCTSRSLISTPKIEFVKSGPVRSWLFRDVPTQFFVPGLFITRWWGRYQGGLFVTWISLSRTLMALLFLKILFHGGLVIFEKLTILLEPTLTHYETKTKTVEQEKITFVSTMVIQT